MELKTLKDMGNSCMFRKEKCCVPDFIKNELRPEAIKWIKDFRIKDKYPIIDVEKWIKHFFNIEEKEIEI